MKYYNCDEKYRPLGAWAYLGWAILYTIPVIGWIFFLINTFRRDNINRRNFTRSYWCGLLVLLIIGGAIYGYVRLQGGFESVADKINDTVMGFFDGTSKTNTVLSSALAPAVTPEFKAMMDSYEALIDEYIEVTEKLENNDIYSFAEYSDVLTRYTDTMEKINAIDPDRLSEADSLYYTTVFLRISQKLIDAAG